MPLHPKPAEIVEYRVERTHKHWEIFSYVTKGGREYRNWVAMYSDYNDALKAAYELTFTARAVAAAKTGAA